MDPLLRHLRMRNSKPLIGDKYLTTKLFKMMSEVLSLGFFSYHELCIPNFYPTQIPSVPSGSSSQNAGTTSIYGPSGLTTNNSRLSRTVITNTSTTPSTTRMTSALPPMVPQQTSTTMSSLHYGHRCRAPGSSVPIVIGNSGIRQRGPVTRLYGNIDNSVSRLHATPVESATTAASTSSQPVSLVRDNRSGPEADNLVWSMLTSFAEDQPSSLNSALAAAIFSQAEARGLTSDTVSLGLGASQMNSLLNAQLSSYAGYALPASYRQWITLSRMLFGHELMDLILISRYNVYTELARKRQEALDVRVKEAEDLAAQQAAAEESQKLDVNEPAGTPITEGPAPSTLTSDSPEQSGVTDATVLQVPSLGSTANTLPVSNAGVTPGEKYSYFVQENQLCCCISNFSAH